MAVYSLLFGPVAWPETAKAPARRHVAPPPEPAARLTLRVPEGLKRRVEASARLDGLPPNTWIVHALTRSVDPRLDTP